jgi:hypothetical protein
MDKSGRRFVVRAGLARPWLGPKKQSEPEAYADTPIRRYADTPIRRHADTPTRRHADTSPPGDPLAELEDITYTGGWLTNEFWHWLGT